MGTFSLSGPYDGGIPWSICLPTTLGGTPTWYTPFLYTVCRYPGIPSSVLYTVLGSLYTRVVVPFYTFSLPSSGGWEEFLGPQERVKRRGFLPVMGLSWGYTLGFERFD